MKPIMMFDEIPKISRQHFWTELAMGFVFIINAGAASKKQ